MFELLFILVAGICKLVFLLCIVPVITIIAWPVVKIMDFLFLKRKG